MERPIGSKFRMNGKTYVVVGDPLVSSSHPCINCAFRDSPCSAYWDVRGRCSSRSRKDNREVHFEITEK